MNIDMTEERLVFCKKFGKELPGLEKPPFPGKVGAQIFNEISADAWLAWKDLQIKIINEYRLNLAERKDYDLLMDQMMSFLGLKTGEIVEVENADRGKGSK